MRITHFFCSLSLALSDQSQNVTPTPLTPPPPTAHNLTYDPAPSATTPETKQNAVISTTKVTEKVPDPGVPGPSSTSIPPPNTNHTSALIPGPTTVGGGGTENKSLTLPPAAIPVPSTTKGPFPTTLSTIPGSYSNTTPNASLSPTVKPSVTTKLPEISTTQFTSIPPGVWLWLVWSYSSDTVLEFIAQYISS